MKIVPCWATNACDEIPYIQVSILMDNDLLVTETVATCKHTIVMIVLLVSPESAEVDYSDKIQIQKQPEFFRNLQSFFDDSTERSITYTFYCH